MRRTLRHVSDYFLSGTVGWSSTIVPESHFYSRLLLLVAWNESFRIVYHTRRIYMRGIVWWEFVETVITRTSTRLDKRVLVGRPLPSAMKAVKYLLFCFDKARGVRFAFVPPTRKKNDKTRCKKVSNGLDGVVQQNSLHNTKLFLEVMATLLLWRRFCSFQRRTSRPSAASYPR